MFYKIFKLKYKNKILQPNTEYINVYFHSKLDRLFIVASVRSFTIQLARQLLDLQTLV